jgi:hypothetical protein
MKFFSKWQPLRDEDAHTALVFGFLRHAPTSVALDVWLTRVLGREVRASRLKPESFWPSLISVVPGSSYTEPEIVFSVDDGQPLTVVVEVKPGYGMQCTRSSRSCERSWTRRAQSPSGNGANAIHSPGRRPVAAAKGLPLPSGHHFRGFQ